jgi:hypothetical protein
MTGSVMLDGGALESKSRRSRLIVLVIVRVQDIHYQIRARGG